ncbi:MAG: Gfo/Idh/MocA family oxidoreductase [Sedimentisphaerales bacterium]|nr:Gfo/Idh/MocA family oxidoreductase [Sedimentisphaerales bacterium]
MLRHDKAWPQGERHGDTMLSVGIVGFGFMGRMHCGHWSNLAAAEVVAVCDSNPALREQAQGSVGNIAGAEGVDLGDMQLYQDLDEMLAAQKLDAVSVTVPTHLHEDVTCKCLAAGIHVLCEKPMALTLEQGRRMIAAAEKAGKVLQIGQCIRFWPEYAYARELITSGRYGRLLAASFHRLTAVPNWSADGWLADPRRSGGLALDLHIHDADFVQYALGMPRSVTTFAARNSAGEPVHLTTRYETAQGGVVLAEAGWDVTEAFGFFMGYELIFQQATVIYDCRKSPTLTVYPARGDAFAPELDAGDGYAHEIEYFAQSICGKALNKVITALDALESLRLVEAEVESLRLGKAVALDTCAGHDGAA